MAKKGKVLKHYFIPTQVESIGSNTETQSQAPSAIGNPKVIKRRRVRRRRRNQGQ